LEKSRVDGAPTGQTFASQRIQDILKSVVAAGSTTGWGQPLAPYAQLVDAFLLSLRSASAFDAMLPWMKVLPLHQQIVVASGGATATTVPEGTAKPIAKLQFSASSITENKTVCIVAITKELLRDANSSLFAQELTRAVRARQTSPLSTGSHWALLQPLQTAAPASQFFRILPPFLLRSHWTLRPKFSLSSAATLQSTGR
jgi:hypothetical protein